MAKLAGKISVITGAAQEISREIALLFAREGADVAIVDRNEKGGEEVAEQIRWLGGIRLPLPRILAKKVKSKRRSETFLKNSVQSMFWLTMPGLIPLRSLSICQHRSGMK